MLTEKKNLDWNDKKKIQDLLDKQKALEEKIRNAVNKNLEKNEKELEFNPIQEDLLDKQKQLEELMEEVLDKRAKTKIFRKNKKTFKRNLMT